MIKIFWVFLLPVVFCSKLNVPRVLLPLSPKHPVNFTLEVTDDDIGCFSWSSSRPDVVLIIPIVDHNQCSNKATIVPTGLFTHKTTAIVVAKDLDSAQVLRCDVILNHIHSLQISMKTHELLIEDAPEQFTVRAWDDQGNEFSSISDLPFEWTFFGQSANGDFDLEPILKWVKFEESTYIADPSVREMERQGLKGYTMLIEGVKTGSTTVSVKLRDEFFKNVPAVEAKIVVQANLIIEPSEVYVLPGSVIPLSVYLIRQGKASKIHLSSSNYYLKAENREIASVSEKDPIVQTGKIGTSRIYLLDRNVESPDISHAPDVLVHVVYPHRLALKLLPYLSWTTMIDETHSIQVEMYDERGNSIICNELVRIETDIPSVFSVNYASNNGSYHYGVVKDLGSYEVKASLKSLKMLTGADIPLRKTLETSAMLTVLPRIALKPSQYVLVWDPLSTPSYRVKYEVVNGGESNEFFTSNASFAAITSNGQATTRGPGWCSVLAHPLGMAHLKANAKLYVLPISEMTVPYRLVEIEVGTRFNIPVFMKGILPNGSIVAVDECLEARLDTEFTNPESFKAEHLAASSKQGCRVVSVTSAGVGTTTLTLSLRTERTVLQQRVTVSSYQPLRHERPRKGFVTLAIDSCYKIILRDGPIHSSIHPSSHFRKVLTSNETVVPPNQARILNKPGQRQGLTEILACCNSEGESDVRYAVGTTSTEAHMHLAEASISTRVICVYPHRVSLLPVIRRPAELNSLCNDQAEPNRYAIQNYVDSKIEMIVEDKYGRRLDNFSSYKVKWTVSDPNLADLNYVETDESDEIDARGYLNFHPFGKEGVFIVNLLMSLPEETKGLGEVSGVLELKAVDAVTVYPTKSTILNHPDVKLSLKMLGGSGHYKVKYEPNNIAALKHFTANHSIQVNPESSGNLEIFVIDRCLWSPNPASVSVQIAEISRIQLQVADKVELGSTVVLTVQMYDASDNMLDPKDLHSIQLETVLGSSIVRVKSDGPLSFVLEGIALGETTISVKAANRESPVLGLQVFPPLRISPRNLTLIIGATFQLVGIGGPQPDTNIQYFIDGVDVASCSYNGIITARKLGHTKVRARAVGVDRYTGLDRVYSEDEAEINVKPLSGIRIIAPLTRVRQGTEMPISFAGLDDTDTPFTFGDSNPTLKIEWTVTNTLSGTIQSLLHKDSKFALGDSDVAIRFTALQPGETVLKLKVTSTLEFQQLKALQFTDELTIHVYEALTVTSLNSITFQSLLMMPNTTLDLRTSIPAKRLVQSIEQTKCVIHVDSDGNLRSDASVGHANLLLTSSNSHGIVQNQNLFVEVRPLSYLLPTASGILWDDVSQSLVIPRGFDARIQVTYHDSLGRTFHGVRKDLKMRASRMDNHRVSYDASTSLISFEGDHPGTTVLQIYDSIHQSVGVFVTLNVINAIHPEQVDFSVGDVVCFTSPLLTSHGLRGKWSSDPKFLDIDGNSGVSVIAHEGVGQVKYHTADGQTAMRDVSATPAPIIRFHDAYNNVITNADEFTYRFPVVLRNKNEPSLRKSGCTADKIESYFAQRPSKLSCHLSFPVRETILVDDLFTVESGFDFRTGFHLCIVKSVSPSASQPTHSTTQLILKAEYGVLSADISLTWEPAFAVKTPEISFNDVEESAFFEISAPASVFKHLEFYASDASALKIGDKHIELPSGARISVFLNAFYATRAASPSFIEIRNKLTGQTEKVSVFFGQSKGKSISAVEPGFLAAVWNFIQYHAVNVFTLAATLVTIYLGYRAFNKATYYRPQANGSYCRTPPKMPVEKPSPLNTTYYAKRSPTLWSVPNETISAPLLDQSAHSAFRTSLLSDKSSYSD